ncbi:MAG: hypothetical protein C0402_12280 [Thermodesulfovibrio sp.]|nr:hypothetical protein [Thermodesulfovibrio sp.]
MNTMKLFLSVMLGLSLAACGGGSSGTAPGAPTAVKVAAGAAAGTAAVSFTAPTDSGSSAITGYTVTATPGGITATGTTSPITLTGLTPQTAYTYSVVAANSAGNSAAATTGLLNFYSVVETFHEPMTQPNDTIFTGTFTFDSTSKTLTNLKGSLTQSMTKPAGCTGMMCYGSIPMTTVTLNNQLSAVTDATLGGLLVTTFALTTTDTFDLGGFAPGGTQYFGLTAGTPNNHNAYAMIFVNTTDPATPLTQAQINKLAYADCTAGGMMMTSCMTGTTVAGYGRLGTMNGVPVSQVITKQ